MFDRFRAWWGSLWQEEQCHMPANIPHGKVGESQCAQHPYSPYGRHDFHPISEEDAKYLSGTPVPLKITIPVTIEEDWKSVCEEEVEEKFGTDVLLNLMVEVMVSPIEYPAGAEAFWFVNGDGTAIMAHIMERVFLCNVASDKRWIELLQ